MGALWSTRTGKTFVAWMGLTKPRGKMILALPFGPAGQWQAEPATRFSEAHP